MKLYASILILVLALLAASCSPVSQFITFKDVAGAVLRASQQ